MLKKTKKYFFLFQSYQNKNTILNLILYQRTMIPSQVDMVCFNQTCINNQTQLFLYKSEEKQRHASHDERCIYIHPSIFNRKYERQTPVLREIKEYFENKLMGTIDQTVQRVAQMLREKLMKKTSQVYDQELDQFRPGNCQNFLNKIKSNQDAFSELNFINSLYLEDTQGMRNHIAQKMKKCEEVINHSFRSLDMQLGQQFQKIVNQFDFFKKQEQSKQKESPEKYVKIELQETPVPESSRMIQEKSIEKESTQKEDINDHKNQGVSQEKQHINDIRRYFKTNKTKPIQKFTKAVVAKPSKDLEQSSEEEYQESQEMSVHEHSLIRDDVCTIRSDIDWIDLLRDPTNYKRLVIYYPLVQEDLLKAIKKTAPKEIYLNYQIKLSSSFIDNIPAHILRHLEKFSQFWDPNEFYDQVLNKQYFPTDDFRFIKSVNKIHYSYKQLNIIPKISNIWISNYYDLQQLKFSIKTIKSIDSLRIEACKCCNNLSQYVIAEIFRAFKETHSLKTLILKHDVLNTENTRLLKELIQINKKIDCIILEIQGKFIPRKLLQCLSPLPLKKLSINSEKNNNGQVVYMDITPIAKILTLQKLAMTNMFFTTQEVTNAEIQSGIMFNLDERIASKISKLTKLIFLDLFRCSPIYPTVVQKLKEKVKRKLYHLNLSHTSMNSSLIAELYTLPKLKELNIDRTNIPLKEFFKEILKNPLFTVTKLSMFHFNGDDLDKVDRIPGELCHVKFSAIRDNEIDKISTCFPNLQYLNIAFCRDFTDLPEHKFKKLKYLCSNKEYMTPAKIEKMLFSRGIEVYLYDGVHKPWNIE